MNAIIFDFDGTIADSYDQVLQFLVKKSGRVLSEEQKEQMRGLSMKELAQAAGTPTWRLPLIFLQGRSALKKHMHQTPIFDGMPAVIANLHQENYQLFIMSSNSRHNISRFLTEHGLGGYFHRIYGNAGWFSKAASLKKVMQQNGLEPEKTVYVGDEVRDVVAAHGAGMPCIAVNWGFASEAQLLQHSPTVLARTSVELEKALIDWGKSF